MFLTGEDLQKKFPIPCQMLITRGTQEGTILKFKTFYLKIYDIDIKMGYMVEGYQYQKQTPVFQVNVALSDFKKFASQFNKEDFLMRFKNQCE